MKSTTKICITFDSEIFKEDPSHCVLFHIEDENDQPVLQDYSMESLESLSDDRLSGLTFSLDAMHVLFSKLFENRTEVLKKLSNELKELTGDSTISSPNIRRGINHSGHSIPYKKKAR
jgi:hypothetical protein